MKDEKTTLQQLISFHSEYNLFCTKWGNMTKLFVEEVCTRGVLIEINY